MNNNFNINNIDNMENAKKYLKENDISYYDDHIEYINEYKSFLYSQDKNYNYKSVIINKVIENEFGEKQLSYDRKKQKRRLTKVQLLALKEFAAMLFNEQTSFKEAYDSNADNQTITENIRALEAYYIKNDIWRTLESSMIEVLGVGTVGMVVGYSKHYGIENTIYAADTILPLRLVGKKIVDACFVGADDDNPNYTRLTIFKEKLSRKQLNDRGYEVLLITLNEHGQELEEYRMEYSLPIRPFIILRPFNRDVIEYSNAFGLPIYWDYLDTIRDIDDLYNLKIRDAQISKRRIFISKDLLVDSFGNVAIPDDLADAFVTIIDNESSNSKDSNKFFQEFNPNPIIEVYDNAIERNIKYFSAAVGLGSNTLSLQKYLSPTATQVISENTEKFNNTLKHYSMMHNEFITLNKAILYYIKTYINDDVDYNIDIMFNIKDNIIEDTNSIIKRSLDEKNSGAMSVYSYLKEVKGLSGLELTEELARLSLDENGLPLKKIAE